MDCSSGGGPPMNTDIAGIGVRISFYLQTLFLAGLSVRSTSLDEIKGALYTLLITNTAMVLTALILGLKSGPEISYHDALIVFYLLCLSWATVSLCVPDSARLPEWAASRSVKLLHLFSIMQSFAFFAYSFIIFVMAPSFGSAPECNPNAVLVFLRPFSALKSGRILALIVTFLITMAYTYMILKDRIPSKQQLRKVVARVLRLVPAEDPEKDAVENLELLEETAPADPPEDRKDSGVPLGMTRLWLEDAEDDPSHDLQIPWDIIIPLVIVLVLWALAVMNTELLIRWNNFAPSDGSPWQFGQILPMFLVILPFTSLFKAFREHGIRSANGFHPT